MNFSQKSPEVKVVTDALPTPEVPVILELPSREKIRTRTYEPNIEQLLIEPIFTIASLEETWDEPRDLPSEWPWKWIIALAVMASLIVGIFIYLPTDDQAPIAQSIITEQAEILSTDNEAKDMITRLNNAGQRYFNATSAEEILPLIRDRQRVEPLVRDHYAEQSVVASRVIKIPAFEPLPSPRGKEFWIGRFSLIGEIERFVIFEIDSSGKPKIDWESLVIHQPMKWDDYATQRPKDRVLDFRVYLSNSDAYPDPAFDSGRWRCLELSAANSESVIYGYVKDGTPLAEKISEFLSDGSEQLHTAILRLKIPSLLESERGVVIEDLISPHWINLATPEL